MINNALKSSKDNLWIVIPARQGSVGFPNKNRLLFEYTALQIPDYLKGRTIVTTDDNVIKDSAKELGFIVVDRPEALATSTANTRDVLLHVKDTLKIKDNDIMIMLYLTFPERKFDDIVQVFDFFKKNNALSVLCKSKIDKHPYLCLYEKQDNKGTQVIPHDLYRRQDYPKCFFVLHYVFVSVASEIKELNKNLYNDNTLYYPIERKIDIDEPEHFEKWTKNK
jgi:CMP-N-acetylneuraminic acid synthetase